MTKNLFSKQQQAQLKLNPYVKTVSAKAITYTEELSTFRNISIKELESNLYNKFSRIKGLEYICENT
ncbi:hypothetical protein ABNX05_11865 [Lysinibacillus sp. M3]|uniref:Uncharacterized protein n=1 Tax=Lysinibacillus zambalensis TaxID=3160866 RepID=A0ABV1MS25_9BACI